jgi:hypothetical protein
MVENMQIYPLGCALDLTETTDGAELTLDQYPASYDGGATIRTRLTLNSPL